MEPFKCPVCDGKGTQAPGFYPNTTGYQPCRACDGKGVLWSPEKAPAVPYIPYVPYVPYIQPAVVPWRYTWSVGAGSATITSASIAATSGETTVLN